MFTQVLQLKKRFQLQYFTIYAKQRVVKSMLTKPQNDPLVILCSKVHIHY